MYEEKLVLLCDNNIEGIFTAVYDGWAAGARGIPVELCTEPPENMELFCRYEQIITDPEKSCKVARSVRRKLGEVPYEAVCYAAAADSRDKGTAIFYVLQKALGGGRCNTRIMEDLADEHVSRVAKLRIRVWHEYHHFLGFVRFREIGGGVLFSQIAPENDILLMLAPHFQNRFPNEHWMIYDKTRRKVLLHPCGQECTVHTEVSLSREWREELSQGEPWEELWRAFCRSITIQERSNKKLQQQLLPLRFRPEMTEFFQEN